MRRILLPLLLASAGFAADNVRFDFATKDGTALEGFTVTAGKGRVALAGWGPEEKRKGYLTTAFAIPAGEWTEVGITFTPAADCDASLTLMGPWKPVPGTDNKELEKVFVTWDKLTIEGATSVNGDFEDLDDKGQPKGWWKGGKEDAGNKVVTDGAKSGQNAILAWHNGQYAQPLKLAGGKPVKISVWAKSTVDPAAK